MKKLFLPEHYSWIVWVGLFLLLAITGLSFLMRGGMIATVTNNSDAIIESVTIKFSGRAVKFGPLQKDENQSARLEITRETNIEVDVYSIYRVINDCKIDTYLGDYSSGTVEILVNKDFAISVVIQQDFNLTLWGRLFSSRPSPNYYICK
jgi:hypothetical protein